jgi:hypothetical protein
MNAVINLSDPLKEAIHHYRAQGLSWNEIREQLKDDGYPQDEVNLMIRAIKSEDYLKRRKRGIILGVTGSILLVIGFILTVIFYHSGISFNLVMYGMTSLGILLLLAGMVDLMGW